MPMRPLPRTSAGLLLDQHRRVASTPFTTRHTRVRKAPDTGRFRRHPTRMQFCNKNENQIENWVDASSAPLSESDECRFLHKLYPGGINNRDTYVTGIALPAIASSGTPNKPVTVGPLAGRTDGTGPGGAWTHRDVVQNVVDYYAYGQSDPATGNNRGGWRYYANYGNSDQSTTQWPVISSLYATKMGVSTPGFVKSELSNWVNYIQNPTTGAAGYQSPFSPLGELNETGALLIMQDYLNLPAGNPRVQAALAYINANWTQFANSTWDGNFGHPYAMWAIYKGLELGVGKGDTTAITNLLTDCGASRGATDVGDVCNWWEDYNEHLVTTQNGDGSWTGYSSWPTALATPWYINILAGTVIPGNGGTVPAPATIALLAAGLLGLRSAQRRAKNA